jgi:hypothetical protein
MEKPLPPEINIMLSRTKILWLIVSLLILSASIYALIKGGSALHYIMAVSGCVVAVLILIMNSADFGELNKPQLIIDKDGMRHRNGDHYSWNDIEDVKIVYQGNHHPLPYLSFKTPTGNRLFNMRHWNKRPEAVIRLIREYRAMGERT